MNFPKQDPLCILSHEKWYHDLSIVIQSILTTWFDNGVFRVLVLLIISYHEYIYLQQLFVSNKRFFAAWFYQ